MLKKIFIIEDDVNVLYSLQAKFSLNGFQVKTNSGNSVIQELIDEVKKFKPDYVILDLILPKVDGFEIIKALKTEKETASSHIFVFTNLSDEDSRTRGIDLGAEQYFFKVDFGIDEFVEKVKKIIENKSRIGTN
ncbi:MAG: response regulator [Patescibacteria group bacterium]